MKRVIIVHGWSGFPEEGWFPWLRSELERRGFSVAVPPMPEPDRPEIEAWVRRLAEKIGTADTDTVLVGHSIGCQTILRTLERLPDGERVGGIVLVAPWFTLSNLSDEEKRIAEPWLSVPIDFDAIRQRTDTISAIFSDNDTVVPIENKTLFEEHLGAKTSVEDRKGHFSGEDGITELPAVLNAILAFEK